MQASDSLTTSAGENHRADQSLRRWQGYLLVVLAGALWASLGLFFRQLAQYGVPAETIALHRAGIASLILLAILAARRRQLLRIRGVDLRFFMLFGIFGVAGFFMVYIYAVNLGSVATAAVLLYTAPIWIALFARWRWGQPLAGARLAALLLAVIGCALVALGSPGSFGTNLPAIIFGLGAGLGYAAYSLYSNEGVRRGYSTWTIMLYSLLLGAVAMIPFQPIDGLLLVARTPAAWPWLAAVAVVPTLAAVYCYTTGIRHIGAPTASIIATVEPLIAALLGWAILGETLRAGQITGGALILAAILILATSAGRHPSAAAAGTTSDV